MVWLKQMQDKSNMCTKANIMITVAQSVTNIPFTKYNNIRNDERKKCNQLILQKNQMIITH
jgi:hypothetical protein